MNTSHKNYKYRTLEAGLFDLLEGSVFFAKHSAFHLTNDKLEGVFRMETDGNNFLKTVAKTINLIYKNRGIANKTIKPQSNPDSSYIKMVEKENQIFINQINRLGIFSASTSYDNQAMWTHYCKNEGVCFELEWDEELIRQYNLKICKVGYSNKQRIVNRDQVFSELLLNVSNEHPEWTVEEIISYSLGQEFRERWMDEFIFNCSCVKKSNWEYENEIRLLSPFSQSINILNKTLKSVYMFLPQYNSQDFISEVFKSRTLRLIWKLLVDKYPKVKLFGLSYNDLGELHKEEIKLSKSEIR